MSEENVEIVRRAFAAGTQRPKPDFETVNRLFHPDHELVSFTSGVEGRSFRGARGFREWLTDMEETWESWEVEVLRATAIDGERVLMVWRLSTRSRQGSIPLERDINFIATVRDGLVTHSQSYGTLEEALEAAGLSE
jgi:ketosteroid isomerase-like protein